MNNKKFIITIIILAVIVAAVSFFAVNEARKNKEMSQLFACLLYTSDAADEL